MALGQNCSSPDTQISHVPSESTRPPEAPVVPTIRAEFHPARHADDSARHIVVANPDAAGHDAPRKEK
jgi:hypothetical protein